MADGRRRDHRAFGALVACVAAGVFVVASIGLNVQTMLERRALAPQMAQCDPRDPASCETRRLEAQIRAAGAAEAASDFAGWALAFNAFGLLGLAAVAVYARRAWMLSQGSSERSASVLATARAGEERRLRAYVTLEELALAPGGGLDRIEVRIRWKNCGQTPARNLVAYSVATTHEDLPEDFVFPDAPDGTATPDHSRSAVRGPGQEVAQTHVIWPQNIANIRDHGHRLYLWGWVEYDDMFAQTPRRRTEFAAQGRLVPAADGQPPRLVLELLRRFNGMDEDCLRKPATRRA